MALQEVVGGAAIIREEALRGFAPRLIATGFGQGGGGMLGQDVREFYEALRAPEIAECGLGQCVDGPVGVIGLMTHARLLGQGVTLGVAGRMQGPSIPQEPLK
jgi:hypothetical protein